MSKPTKLDKIWAKNGAIVDPGDTKTELGWVAEIPPYQHFNHQMNKTSQMLDHINTQGIPEWDALTVYTIGAKVLYSGVEYKCTTGGASTSTPDLLVNWIDTNAIITASIEGAFKGKAEVTLSEYDTDAAPAVQIGSVFDNAGTFYKIESAAETPTGYSGIAVSTTFYLYFDESATAFIYDTTTPTWSDDFQGWYNGNDRALFSMYKDSGGTLYSYKENLNGLSIRKSYDYSETLTTPVVGNIGFGYTNEYYFTKGTHDINLGTTSETSSQIGTPDVRLEKLFHGTWRTLETFTGAGGSNGTTLYSSTFHWNQGSTGSDLRIIWAGGSANGKGFARHARNVRG